MKNDRLTSLTLRLGFTSSFAVMLVAQANAQIGSSGDDGQPSTVTAHLSAGNTFNIIEDVDLDPTSGPWVTQLSNPGGKASGDRVNIFETLTNDGSEDWTGWVEEVLSTTQIAGGGGGGGGGGPVPGFLFDNNTISVQADYGGGLVALTQGIDYTLTGVIPFPGPQGPFNNNGYYSQFEITFAAGKEIGPGETLRIEKQIFEVFLDGDTWQSGIPAEVGNYPVPEPASLLLLGLGGALAMGRRR